jgi:hypothetical protein
VTEQPSGCNESAAPACGGECPDGLTCAPDPESEDECDCLNDCQLSAAPTCGGSCESEPGNVCTPLEIGTGSEDAVSICQCLPPNAAFCEFTAETGCNGACTPGHVCESDGDNGCLCSQLPAQPECGAAGAPDCFGSCADTIEGSTICEFDGVDACTCVPYVGQPESCFDADGPTCGGVCAFGDVCAVDVGGGDCECNDPCDISQAPACGGECLDPGEVCTSIAITLNGQSKDFCECR